MKMNFISPKNQTQNLTNHSKLVTGGNDPSISCAMNFSQTLRHSNRYCKFLIYPSIILNDITFTLQYKEDLIFDYDPTIKKFALQNKTIPIYKTFTLNAISDSPGTITYKSSDTSILYIKGNNGVALKPGNVIITARQEKYGVYHSASTTANVFIYRESN
jgi:hypothetical protein